MPQTCPPETMPVVTIPNSRHFLTTFGLRDAVSLPTKFFRVVFNTLTLTLTTLGTFGMGLVPAVAQIVPDGSTATKVQGNVIVPTGTGTVNGGNLYHSFDKFNVPTNGVVFGTGNSAVNGAQVNNIINRVTGDTPSQILGTIESRQAFPNANLYLMNPNGIIFSKDAKLDVGGSFYATTGTGMTFAPGGNLGSNFQVDKNSTTFPNGDPQSIQFAATQPAAIINQGNLAVREGQTLSLTGGTVVNTGNLSAPQGNITLQSVSGQQQVEIRSPNSVLGLSVTGLNPQWQGKLSDIPQLAAMLTGPVPEANQVVVQGDGSLALVQASTPDSIPANSIPVNQGSTVFTGTANAVGGTVRILGTQIALTNGTINTASENYGGNIFVGGDYQGQGTTPRANYTYISPTTFFKADALTNGNGGKVIIWADGLTRFFGDISAQGGPDGGDGGFVEVSGKERLQFSGNVTTFAPLGKNGSLLLDPTDIDIVFTGSATGSFVIAAGNSNYLPTNGGPDQIINTTIDTLLLTNNVTISTASVGTATGILNVNAPIAWNSANRLTLIANNTLTINIGANITTTGTGSFTAISTGDLNVQSSIQLAGGNLSLTSNSGNVTVNGTGQPIVTGGGKMTFRSNQANTGTVTLVPGTVDSGGGDITFITDNISLGILTNTGGKVIIEPATPGRGILLTNGLADSSRLSLDGSTITALNSNTYQLITIGNNNNSGDITSEGGVSLDKSPIQFLTPGNFIVAAGGSTYGDLQVTAANTKLFGNLAGTNRTFNSNFIIETSGVNLRANPTLGGGNVIITGTINGLTGGENFGITVNGTGSTGSLTLLGAVGNNQPLGQLSLNTGVNADLRAITAKGLTVNGFSGTVNFLGAVNLDSDGLDVGSTPPVTNINVGSPITILNSGFLSLRASNLLSVNGALRTNGGNTNLFGNTVNINAQVRGNTINQGSLNIGATNAITIAAAAPIVSGAGTAIGFGGATSTSVAGSISSQGNMLFGSPVTLTGTTTIQSNDQADGIVFQNTLNGAGQSLTLVSDALTFGGAVSGLGNLTLKPATNAYPVQLGGVAVNGSLSLTSGSLANLFPGVTSLNVGGGTSGNITAVATVPSIPIPLTLQPAIGSRVIIQTPLTATGSGSLNVIGPLDLNGNITTAGGGITQSGGAVNLQTNITLDSSSGSGAISLGGTIDGAFDLIVNSGSNNITFGSALGNTTPLGNLALNSTGLTSVQGLNVNTLLTRSLSRVTLNGNVTSTNSQTYGGEVFIGGSGITLNSSANNGPISFASTVNSATATPTNLTINPGLGDITFQGAVGNTNRLGILTISRPAIFNVGVNQFDQNVTVDSLVTAQGGVSTIINGNITTNTTAGQVYNNPVVLKNNVVLDSSAGNGAITFNSTLQSDGTKNPNLTLAAGTGAITFGGVVGGSSAAQNLNDLVINSASSINIANNITSAAGMTFTQPVNITGATVILASNGGGTNFGSTLNGGGDLTVSATGVISFAGAVGNTSPLSSLEVNASQIRLNDNFNVTNNLSFFAPVTLSNSRNTPITLTAGRVGFSDTLDGSRSVTVNSTQPASFSTDIGATTPLNSLTVATPNYTSLQNITVVGDLTLGNIQSTSSPGTPIQLRSTSGNIVIGTITHVGNSDVPSGGTVSVNSDNGSITVGAIDTRAYASGPTAAGGAVSLQTKGSLNINGSVNTSSTNSSGGKQDFTVGGSFTSGDLISSGQTDGGDITVKANTSITTGNINASSSIGKGGNVLLDPVGNVVVGSINTSGATQGGNVTLVSTGGALQLLNTITSASNASCIGASICTAGGTGGLISLQHGGLNPFVVGSPTINGAAGFLTNGLNTIPVGTTIPVVVGSDYIIGNIRITPGGIVSVIPVPSGPVFVNPTVLNPLQPNPVVTNRVTNISEITRTQVDSLLRQNRLAEAFNVLEQGYQSQLEVYTGRKLGGSGESGSAWVGIDEGQQLLAEISQRTGSSAALIYPVILDDRIEIMVIPPKDRGAPFRRTSNPVTARRVNAVLQDYAVNLRDTLSRDYLEQSRELYNWVIAPIDEELQRQKIDTLVFVMDGAMRIVPPAALHDGKQFLVERYATVNIPSLRLTRLEYRDRANNRVLAMGLTEAVSGFSRLPAVEVELRTISEQILNGQSFLNQDFTIENMQQQRRNSNYGILHLGTHGKFVSDTSNGSFIQFWDSRLRMDQITKLRFDSPAVEMMTLSACETAVGSNLGISGLAIESGARSVLASLWTVSDAGTAPLMISFYRDFPDAVHKAAALRSAQISLLSGKVRLNNGVIEGIPGVNGVKLPEAGANIDLRHPFYWSSFILVGNWL
ncbi:MAG: CHAT domain-containing protein [Pseudanabaenaceae cyanobacterium]